jgi:hypothetical protein
MTRLEFAAIRLVADAAVEARDTSVREFEDS